MEWLQIGLTVAIALSIAWLLRPLVIHWHLPFPSVLVFVGFVVSEVLIALGMDTGLRWNHLHWLVYYVFLPVLIYEIAFRLKAVGLFLNMVLILLLSFPLMLLSVLMIAVFLFLGINHSEGFPFIAALITAALLSSNDPAAVNRIVSALQAPPRLVSLLKGESLFNGILVLVLVSLAFNVGGSNRDVELSFLQGFIALAQLFTGGILTGLLCGLLGWVFMRWSRWAWLRMVFSLLVAYGTFFLAELGFGVSGIVAALTAGLLLNAYSQRTDEESSHLLDLQWKYTASFANAVLFILLGVSIHLPILQHQWLAVLLGIAAMLLARAVIVFAGLWLYGYVDKSHQVPIAEQKPLFWGGIKGAVTVALTFALPDSSYSATVQAIVYGVVLFGLFVQAPTLRFLLPKY